MLLHTVVLLYLNRNPLPGVYPLLEEMTYGNAAARRLKSALEEVAIATGKTPLKCLVVESSMPNALALVLKDEPHLMVTSGLLKSDLTREEMASIVAHETAHIAAGDALNWKNSTRLDTMVRLSIAVTLLQAVITAISISSPSKVPFGNEEAPYFLPLKKFYPFWALV